MILACAGAWAGPWLVGVRNERGALSTWWVDEAGLTALGPGLAAPGPDGAWWRAEPVTWGIGGYTEVAVRWVGPDDAIHQPHFSPVRRSRWTGTSTVALVGVAPDRVTTETALDVTGRDGAALRQVTVRTDAWPPGSPPLAPDAAPVPPPDAVPLGPGLRLVADDDGLHLVTDDGGGTDVAVRGARLVLAWPVPAGQDDAWRAAATARLAR